MTEDVSSSDPKRQWLHDALQVNFAVKKSAKPNGGGNDTDLMKPDDEETPAAPARYHNDTDLMDPNADDAPAAPTEDPTGKVKHAADEMDDANKDVAAKEKSVHDAEQALDKAHKDLDASKTKAEEKTEEYYETEAKGAHGAPGAGDALPRPMQPDCVPVKGKVSGPDHHVLCKTHGHVLNLQSKMIIANSLAEYEALHPVPRPIQTDCKMVSGKLPYAPDNIVVCEPHGHVIDKAKKQIVANSVAAYLSAHPEYAQKPKAKDKEKAAGKPATAAPDKPAAPAAPDKKTAFIGSWNTDIMAANDLENVSIMTSVREDGHFSYAVGWKYSDTAKIPLVARVEIAIVNGVGKSVKDVKEDYSSVLPGTRSVANQDVALPKEAFDGDSPMLFVDVKIVAAPKENALLEARGQIDLVAVDASDEPDATQ